jgi:hypothetical protein
LEVSGLIPGALLESTRGALKKKDVKVSYETASMKI